MPDKEKKNSMLSMLKGVLKGKRDECGDIVTQAEKVVSDYISRRRNEIINKYCKKKNPFVAFLAIGMSGVFLYLMYMILN